MGILAKSTTTQKSITKETTTTTTEKSTEKVLNENRNFNYPEIPRPELPKCPLDPPKLNGPIAVSYDKPYPWYNRDFPNSKDFPPSFDELKAKFPHSNHFSVII